MMEFWRSCLQIFQDLTHIIPLPLCWDSIEYLWEARPAPRLVCLLDMPGLSSIRGCSGKTLTLGTLDTFLTMLTSRIFWPIKKMHVPFNSDAREILISWKKSELFGSKWRAEFYYLGFVYYRAQAPAGSIQKSGFMFCFVPLQFLS